MGLAIPNGSELLGARTLIETIESDNLAKKYFVDKAIQEAEFVRSSTLHPYFQPLAEPGRTVGFVI